MPDAPLQRARELILRFGWNSMAYQILNPGMELWFSADGEAVIGYVIASGYRVVAGAPICDETRLADVSAAFHKDATSVGLKVCYFGAQERLAEVLGARGPVARMLLGAQPMWHPQNWKEQEAGKASLRAQLARARNKKVTVAAWSVERAVGDADLKRCLHEWLSTRGLPTLHFLVEPETLERLYDRKVFVAERGESVVGFLVASPIPLRRGWLIEQFVRGRGAPNGTVELLLDAAMRDLTEAGAEHVTLGLSPLSRHADLTGAPMPAWLSLLLKWMRAHGQRFYNFEGLDNFKAKFMPESWEPVYAMTCEASLSPRVLYAITGAFGGTSPLRFMKAALMRALQLEWKWLMGRRDTAKPMP